MNPSVQPLCAKTAVIGRRVVSVVTIPPPERPKFHEKLLARLSDGPLPFLAVNPLFTDGHHLGPIM